MNSLVKYTFLLIVSFLLAECRSNLKLYSVLVTGANRNLGLQFVIELIKLNPKYIIATCRDPDNAKELNELANNHSNIHILQLELIDYSSYDSFINKVNEIVGEEGLTLFIQNAGLKSNSTEDELNPDQLIKMYQINAVAPILLTRKLLPILRKSTNSGRRTIAAFMSSYFSSIKLNTPAIMKGDLYLKEDQFIGYRMSKTALNQGVRTLATRFKNDTIEFVLMHPGHVLLSQNSILAKYWKMTNIEDSIKGLLKQLENEELTRDGRVITYDGKLLPW